MQAPETLCTAETGWLQGAMHLRPPLHCAPSKLQSRLRILPVWRAATETISTETAPASIETYPLTSRDSRLIRVQRLQHHAQLAPKQVRTSVALHVFLDPGHMF